MPGKGKKPISSAEMEKIVRDLRKRTTVLSALSKSLKATEEAGEEIEVMGQPMVVAALESLDGFIRSCKRELGEI